MNILKLIKGIVKGIAVIISIAFLINALTGVTTVVNMMDNQGVQVNDINPGDFRIKFDDLHIEIGLTINNTGIYPLEGVKLGMRAELKSNISDQWHEIIDTDSTKLNTSIPEYGETIYPNQVRSIILNASLPDFTSDPTQIATILGISDPNWDLADLLNTSFEIRVFLSFDVAYAYKQYNLHIGILLNSADLEGGF
ncbi:MAG: hypothetical protein K9W44_11120 [Candidatus Lokiarchaeota archaeon]|nr:hypothetical protein [Candidatus Harpocratesius repetitus]